MRGVTTCDYPIHFDTYNFNSHASCEAWPVSAFTCWTNSDFNSHASCEAWRDSQCMNNGTETHFNSHASCEAWQKASWLCCRAYHFNSHASCEAWQRSVIAFEARRNFNSHASCEAWPICIYVYVKMVSFQLTRLMRGVTRLVCAHKNFVEISTHTPHARRDEVLTGEISIVKISTHTPHARRDN